MALLLERSAEAVVALLGVLKAGGAYLPLEPEHPRERLALTLADARPTVVLTTQHLTEKLPDCAAQVILVDADGDAFAGLSDENPESGVTAANCAYVIYTSGSTGRPKGVQITHANVSRLLAGTQAWFEFGPQDVWTMFHSYAFDFSVWELWGALAYGGRLVVVPYLLSRSPEAFYELLVAEKVTVLNQTPSAFRQLIHAEEARGGGAAGLSLRLVIFGGEALEVSALAPWFARHGDSSPQLVNMYGITETTVHVTYRRLLCDDARAAVGSVIGAPIGDLTAYVLDERLQLVPPGVAGELYVGGAGLARGYLGRPGLTAEKFIPHPFPAQPGARLYRTGDVVRYAGSEIEYLGRCDEQVKVRGFRIELGEIEAVLTQHAAVREAVVVLRDEVGGDKRLVAYLVTAAGDDEQAAPPDNELRLYLKERVPEYMVPAAFVRLERMPLTPNGKLDRRALPEPAASRPDLDSAFVASRTPVEEMLINFWCEMLGLEQVGVHDSFFALGGHSLLATQLASRVREAFGVELPLRELFEQPTVAELACHVESRLRADSGSDVNAPALRRVSRNGALPLSFAQQRLWLADQLEPGDNSYNVPAALRLSGTLDAQVLGRTLSEVVRRHESLRTTFPERDGQPVQVVHPASEMALEVEDLGAFAEAEREAEARRLADEESQLPFDLAAGPLLRVRLLRLAEDEHVLLFTMHHIVTDGWSMGVLVREVAQLYEAYLKGEESPLQEPPVQYADFAAWQRRWMSGEVLERELQYWRRQLGGELPVLELPTDRPRPAVQTFRGASNSFVLDGEWNRALSRLSQGEGATRFMVLLSAFEVLLHYYSRQDEVVVGINVANRNRREIEGVIGFFVNTLVLRNDLTGDPTFRELLRRVRAVALGAYAHQDLPFEKLAAALQANRGANPAPLFRVKVEYDEQTKIVELPGLRLTPLEVGDEVVRTDLRLGLADGAEELLGRLFYDEDLFNAATIGRMVENYETLLRRILAEPEARLSELVEALAEDDRAHALKRLAGGKKANLQRMKERMRRPAPDMPAGEESRV